MSKEVKELPKRQVDSPGTRWPFLNAAISLIVLTAAYLAYECRQLGRKLIRGWAGPLDSKLDANSLQSASKNAAIEDTVADKMVAEKSSTPEKMLDD